MEFFASQLTMERFPTRMSPMGPKIKLDREQDAEANLLVLQEHMATLPKRFLHAGAGKCMNEHRQRLESDGRAQRLRRVLDGRRAAK